MAAGCGHTLVLEILLEQRDIDVNAVTPRNTTALHFAASYGGPEAVQLLLNDRRIDPAVRNGFGLAQFDAPLDPVDQEIFEKFNAFNASIDFFRYELDPRESTNN
ncbi:hypothetical protein L873DRAFT_1792678 [Choiromyces venosus 120613-1]|uniref:Uncharacterized protein n=1 Tax=Choiromyces venosus 120613-1 TaxID=1336337 RepID=A0A3N4J9F9_9PEZI|nr:hypothetical protein L873DRAFT_1792678 [Choiromyces venosus 120613-1]